MAPKFVNHEKKRFEIICLSYDLLIENGIHNFSIDALIKHLNMAKGTFYHYFSSKDDLINAMMDGLIQDFMHSCSQALKKAKSIEEKLEKLFEIYLADTKESRDFLNLYNEYLLFYTHKGNALAYKINSDYNTYMKEKLIQLFVEEIQKGRLKEESLLFINALLATVDGFLIHSAILKEESLSKELRSYLSNFIKLIEH